MINTLTAAVLGGAIGYGISKMQEKEQQLNNTNPNQKKLVVGFAILFGSLYALSEKIEAKNKVLSKKAKNVWDKAENIPLVSPDIARRDKAGKMIKKVHYGDRSKKTGWEIDHSKPRAEGGTDHLNNLQALNWRDNVKKGKKLRYKFD